MLNRRLRGLQMFGFGCRIYSDAEGRRSGLPSISVIRRALTETLSHHAVSAGRRHELRSLDGSGFLAAGSVAAILASTCCLGPLILVLLGFSGAWIGSLSVLEPYRPMFLESRRLRLSWRRGVYSGQRRLAKRMEVAPPRDHAASKRFSSR